MRTVLAATAALVIGATTFATPATAAPAPRTLSLGAHLTGKQEVPKGKGDPDATGIALLQLHRDNRLCYVIRVRNVDGDIDAAHIHAARPGRNGPVSVALTAPTWSGSVATCTQLSGKLARRLRDDPDRYYVNVHSSAYPDGALRGQLHSG
ncbi:CHRD domain-containing protein [Dactylosporangium cerinum]|uniref:CHRD domain-containing protein n=1 Tax=Dactylosporangium cerinum TaxID=1434730 RepID=A0ABV9VLD4_9ACTN